MILEYIPPDATCIDDKEYVLNDKLGQYVNQNKYNFMSYGIISGKYKIDLAKLLSISNFKYYIENYTFTEKKTKFYKLMFDIDFKDDVSQDILNLSSDIQLFLCNNIVIILNKLFEDINTEYIYCTKNIGYGLHIYFPHIIVNSQIHVIIRKSLLEECIKEIKYKFINDKTWENIIDGSITLGTSIRLCYYHKDGSYYYPDWTLSTYPKIDSQIKVLETCIISTNATKYNYLLSNYAIDLLENESLHIQNRDVLITDGDIAFMKNLFDILSIDRLDKYDTWIAVIFLARVYDLKYTAIKVSQKSHKYDSKSLDKIESIWNNPVSENHYTMNTLIMWAMKDNEYDTMVCHRKYGREVYIPSSNNSFLLDQIFLHDITIKPDYVEATKYVSDDAFNNMCQAIYDETM